jgi:hypothetical protein
MINSLTSTVQYDSAVSALKIQAILAIVFGGLGILLAFALVGLYILVGSLSMTELQPEEAIELAVYGIVTPIALFITHIYLVISGIVLLKKPDPKIVKALSITNIVVGAMFNLIVLIFAVLFIAKSGDYEKGYKPTN